MANTELKKKKSILPFFGERMNIIGGLDALRHQNTSDKTYRLLLPGLNNVTSRMRYYSFYCWLLDYYSEESGSTDPKGYRRFIRKAEYLTALASRVDTGDISRIAGSNYTSEKIEQEEEVFDLVKGIYNQDGSTEKTYWKFTSGIMGQYYQGSMHDIGIITSHMDENGIMIRTENQTNSFIDGKQLAEAFDHNLNDAQKELFMRCMETEQVSKSELPDLLPGFSLAIIPDDSKEQELLTAMLLQKDHPRTANENAHYFRKQTITYLLWYLEQHKGEFDERSFINYCFEHKGYFEEEPVAVLTGWYFYQFNEYWQYANAAILSGLLEHLQQEYDLRPVFLDVFTEKVTEFLFKKVAKENGYKDKATVNEVFHAPLQSIEQSYAKIKDSKGLDKVHQATLLYIALFREHEDQLSHLHKYGAEHFISDEGAGIKYYFEVFPHQKERPFRSFLKDYIKNNILLRHQFVAYRKMGNGNQSTQKFILEDHQLRYIAGMSEAFTGPRIGSLIQFLKDLNLLDSEYRLTARGIMLKEKLWNETN